MSDVGLIEYDKLEDGTKLMYKNENLTSVECSFPNLKNGTKMFSDCSSLTDVNISDLSKLENGNMMFYRVGYKSFNCNLPALKYGRWMFGHSDDDWRNTSTLISFTGDLSTLVDGRSMFNQQYKLTNFTTSKLSNLKAGYKMFNRTSLSLDSIINIVNSLPDINHLDRENDLDWTYLLNGENQMIEKEERGVISINGNLSDDELIQVQKYLENGNEKGWYIYRHDESDSIFTRRIPFVYKNELSLKVEKYKSGSYTTIYEIDLIFSLNRTQGLEGHVKSGYKKVYVDTENKYGNVVLWNGGEMIPTNGYYDDKKGWDESQTWKDDGTCGSDDLIIFYDSDKLEIYFDVSTNKSNMTVNFKNAKRKSGTTGKYRVYVNNELVSEVG